MENKPPLVTRELVEWLERLFPVTVFGPAAAHGEMMYAQGAASVVRKVRAEYTSQQR